MLELTRISQVLLLPFWATLSGGSRPDSRICLRASQYGDKDFPASPQWRKALSEHVNKTKGFAQSYSSSTNCYTITLVFSRSFIRFWVKMYPSTRFITLNLLWLTGKALADCAAPQHTEPWGSWDSSKDEGCWGEGCKGLVPSYSTQVAATSSTSVTTSSSTAVVWTTSSSASVKESSSTPVVGT